MILNHLTRKVICWMALTWPTIADFDPIYLNLGGGLDCHPRPEYQH